MRNFLVTCVTATVLALGLAASAHATTTLLAPAADATLFTGENFYFDWTFVYGSDQDQLQIDPAPGSPSVQQPLRVVKYLPGTDVNTSALGVGDWVWRVCTKYYESATFSDCSPDRNFTIIPAPIINRSIARRELRKVIKRKWHVSSAYVRCTLDSDDFYSCSARWHTKRTKYWGSGSVYLSEHKYFASISVSWRERR